MIASMGLTAMSLVFTVMVYNIHFHSPDTPVPNWMRKTFLSNLPVLLCLKSNDKSGSRVQPVSEDQQIISDNVETIQVLAKKKDKKSQKCVEDTLTIIAEHFYDQSKAQNVQENNREEWQMTAKVCDRMLLYIFLIAIIIISSVFYGLMLTQPIKTTSGYFSDASRFVD